ncbi:hypothetical protein B4U80_05683 [Leptotrombidium deliense]|uniref:Fe2OG dioxygenase domain-containing protein n=1 Tax=Leptotrombidium deliense TaxID=299467 RepID=A0A443SL19_9ACAR|nr:hypothetical protein B4U80_05683 [Leptotrombidium deliense]
MEPVNEVTNMTCSCKGIRTCLVCEELKPKLNKEKSAKCVFYYCEICGDKAWTSVDHRTHGDGNNSISVNGVFLAKGVINESEETEIVNQIDSPLSPSPWVGSQSGRRKQDYGPKVNFKKKLCKIGRFVGIPKYAHTLMKQFLSKFEVLKDFRAVELCNLEYVPERGSSIDPHLDDDWLWGERLVTLNLLSTTILTLTRVYSENNNDDDDDVEVAITLPARSLLVLYGEARFRWYHSVKRKDITERRLAMTWRELTPLFLPDGDEYESIGKDLLQVADREI